MTIATKIWRQGRPLRLTASAAALLSLLGTAAACRRGGGEGAPAVTTSGGLQIEARLSPDLPREKGNALLLEVRDARGGPVSGAEVAVRYRMPAMGTMGEMRGDAEVREEGAGRYRARFDLPMGGSWTLAATVRAGDAAAEVEYGLTVGSTGLTAKGGREGTGPAAGATTALPRQDFPPAVLEPVRSALQAYEEARQALARDEPAAVGAPAARAAAALRLAESAGGQLDGPIRELLAEGARIADSLGAARDLAGARSSFGELSRILLLLANGDPRIAEGWHVFECPMTDTFRKWIQPSPDLENPYMGRAMPTCGSPTDFTVEAPRSVAEARAHAEAAHGGDLAYYTCSMHPSVRKQEPGTCPICSMNLVPVTREEAATGAVALTPQRRQEIGVTTARVERRPRVIAIRAVGKVAVDESRRSEITLKVAGYVSRLTVDKPGQFVRRGQTLFTLYSPELYSAQREYLAALDSQRAARSTSAPDRADYLVAAARERLRLWDLTSAQIERLERGGEPLRDLPIVSPVSGFVVEKNVVVGAAVAPGQALYRLAGLDRVWVEAAVYEADLPLVEVGQEAEITLSYLPGKRFGGRVVFVYPYLAAESRTGTVRIELANPNLALKPEMFADVLLRRDLGPRLMVPESAVLYAGEREFVFRDLGEGRLQPHAVELGHKSGASVEIVSGLTEGETVVTSANFLVAAESRLKLALEQWR